MPLAAAISPLEYYFFHAVDRQLFTTLVDVVGRDPIAAVQMMAVWFWLERAAASVSSLSDKILALPSNRIRALGDEALICWNCLEDRDLLDSPFVLPVPATCDLLDKRINTEFLRRERESAVREINWVIVRVFPKCLKDIWERAMHRAATAAASLATAIHPDERTLFATFSKGYPVSEPELREFMTAAFGDCVESVFMDPVPEGAQSLYAKIVLRDPRYMAVVLGPGPGMGKYTINGKHVWMRKFVPKRRESSV